MKSEEYYSILDALDELEAYIRNARGELATLRSDIIGALSSPSDLFLKVSLVQDVDVVDGLLRKALL